MLDIIRRYTKDSEVGNFAMSSSLVKQFYLITAYSLFEGYLPFPRWMHCFGAPLFLRREHAELRPK